jgi:HPt (histidine-containing phosphotransfer) domain-containing protein
MSEMGKDAINPTILESLRELQSPGEPDLIEELFLIFFRDVPPRLEEIKRLVALNKIDEAGRIAHSLKSASANLGCDDMSQKCAALESMGREGLHQGAEEALRNISKAYARVVAQARDLAPGLAKAG